uniref:G-protein coupled receptors family 3 profile domain-containing protein n=1 Tax=Leptobrachium leishanense TaxID=445787 RepID=A0A8C5PL88_9ANUR
MIIISMVLVIPCIAIPSLRFLRHFLAFDFAVHEINNDRDLLSNTTLGYSVYDTCIFEEQAQAAALNILSGGSSYPFNYSCNKNTVAAFIGHLISSVTLSVANLLEIYGYTQLNKHLRRVHFNTSSGNEFFFHETENSKIHLVLINNIIFPNKTIKKLPVGEVILAENSKPKLIINESAILWPSKPSDINEVPQSTCSEQCPPGFRKSTPDQVTCCYSCVQCSAGEISNQTDMENCLQCPADEYPDAEQVICLPRTILYLSYSDPLGATFAAFAIILIFITVVILGIFIIHRNTPIVRANNTYLSYIILASLILSFLSSLLFIGSPSNITCLLQNVFFNIIFAIVVTSVLAKTITVLVAFSAVKPGSKFRIFLGFKVSISTVFLGSFGEFGICLWWLTFWPPYQDKDSTTEATQLILHCNVGSYFLFYIALGYNWFLALICFVVAFLAKRLPDLFNEARYITFSMLVFCSVWVSFIPAYISTKGKYMIAVEIFAILASSAGVLSFIFFPKCFIIILKPELNIKQTFCITSL